MSKRDDAKERKLKRERAKRRVQHEIKLSPFDLYIRKCKIINVVDGDTVDCVIDMGYMMFATHRIRLLGVDTPELRSKDADERMRAQDAKNFVFQWISNSHPEVMKEGECYLTIQSQKADSFGRWLGEIKNSEGGSLGQALLDAELAEVYEK